MSSPLAARDFSLHLPQGRLEAVWIGPGPKEKPTLVLLHEGLGSVALWRDVPQELARATGCGVLVYSRLGYGASDPCSLPRPLDFMEHEGQVILPEVIRQAGIDRHVVVGHSDGGSIALVYAGSDHRPGLTGVVTMAAHVFCEAITRQSIRAARHRYAHGDLKARLQAYHGENTDGAFAGWCDAWLHPDFSDWSIEAFLPALAVPLLAIQGVDDPYGSDEQLIRIADQSGGVVQTERIVACGHAPHLEREGAVLALVADFSRRVVEDGER